MLIEHSVASVSRPSLTALPLRCNRMLRPLVLQRTTARYLGSSWIEQ